MAIQDPWRFHINFRMNFSISTENLNGILMEIVVNLEIAFGIDILATMVILPKHEHGRYLHLFVFFSFFQNVLDLSLFKSFIYLVKLIPKFFDAILFYFLNIIYCQIGLHTTPSAHPNECPLQCPSPTFPSPPPLSTLSLFSVFFFSTFIYFWDRER